MGSLSGSYLGRYRVGEVLGVGGFGAVYLGRDEGLDADVAIKVLADHYSLSPDARERFLGEGRLLRRVDHSGVLTVHDVGETDDLQPYLVLQYAEGGSLADRLDNADMSVSTEDIAEVANQLADALSAVHDAGIVHRDLAPDNIFITGGGRSEKADGSRLLQPGEALLVGDLGLAKDIIAGSGITSGAGTEGFAAPEQRTAAGTVTPAADIYGASVLLKFLAESAGTASTKARVERAVSGGLIENPAARPQTAGAWRDMVIDGLAAPTSDLPGVSSPSRMARLGVLAAAIVGLAALLWATAGDTTTEPAVTLFDGSELAEGWRDASWGPEGVVVFAPPDPTIQLQEFDAMSIITDSAISFSADQFLVVEFGDDAVVDQLGFRLNDETGDELAVCRVDNTDLVRRDGTSVEIVIPGSLLETDGQVSRIAILNEGGPDRVLQLTRLYIADRVSPEPTAESCAPRQ